MAISTPTRITVNQLADFILGIINKGDQAGEMNIDRREVMENIRKGAVYLLNGERLRMRNEGEKNISSYFVASYNLPVLNDTSLDKNYVDIPVNYIDLPKSMGVYSVFGGGQFFIPVPLDFEMIFANLPAGALEMQFAYEVDRYKIWFYERNDAKLTESGVSSVRVRLVTHSPMDIDDDEPLPLPDELHWQLVNLILERYGIRERFTDNELADNR